MEYIRINQWQKLCRNIVFDLTTIYLVTVYSGTDKSDLSLLVLMVMTIIASHDHISKIQGLTNQYVFTMIAAFYVTIYDLSSWLLTNKVNLTTK